MRSSPGLRTLLYAVGLIALGVLLVPWILNLLPQPLSDTAESIGNGTPAVVLVHHPTAVETHRLQELVLDFRREFSPAASFVVLDVNQPRHQNHIQELGVRRPAIAFVSADGQRQQIISQIDSARDLDRAYRAFIDAN